MTLASLTCCVRGVCRVQLKCGTGKMGLARGRGEVAVVVTGYKFEVGLGGVGKILSGELKSLSKLIAQASSS